MNIRQFAAATVITIGVTYTLTGYASYAQSGAVNTKPNTTTAQRSNKEVKPRVIKTEEEWRRQLTPRQFAVTRKKKTEQAFSGKYDRFKGKGVYQCVGCDNLLFRSDTKFASGTGWPSFWKPLSPESIRTEVDTSDFPQRTEVLCRRCDAHLGHVFDDGPNPTGLRYCMNSVALKFIKSPVRTK